MSRSVLGLVLICSAGVLAVPAMVGAAGPSKVWRLDGGGNPYPESATSFDCARASTNVERMICGDVSLAIMDGELGDYYQIIWRQADGAERSRLGRSQLAWLDLRDACHDRQCIVRAYEKRLATLEKLLEARRQQLHSRMSRIGQCQETRIVGVGPRLQLVEGEPPQGTSVIFHNAVRQVSYDPIPGIWESRVGDLARVCLVSVPSRCPVGDDRGRVYRATNLRTGARWTLPDSSHACGGA